MSPTQRTLAELRRRGWTSQIVEHWQHFAKRRIDLFGCIDIVAIASPPSFYPAALVGIQCTSGSSHSARRHKIAAEPRMREWLQTGARLSIWSWSKTGARGKRKTWTLREEEITLSTLTSETSDCRLGFGRKCSRAL